MGLVCIRVPLLGPETKEELIPFVYLGYDAAIPMEWQTDSSLEKSHRVSPFQTLEMPPFNMDQDIPEAPYSLSLALMQGIHFGTRFWYATYSSPIARIKSFSSYVTILS